jgi:hypothetical protein
VRTSFDSSFHDGEPITHGLYEHSFPGRRLRTFYSDLDALKGDIFTTSPQSFLGDVNKAKAAGHLHVKDFQAFYIATLQDLGDFIHIGTGIIKLGTTYGDCFIFQKIAVEVGIGKGDAVGN